MCNIDSAQCCGQAFQTFCSSICEADAEAVRKNELWLCSLRGVQSAFLKILTATSDCMCWKMKCLCACSSLLFVQSESSVTAVNVCLGKARLCKFPQLKFLNHGNFCDQFSASMGHSGQVSGIVETLQHYMCILN